MFLRWSAKSLNIQSLSPRHSTWESTWAQRAIENDALKTTMTTFMSYEGYFCIKERAPITVIMKLKSMMLSACIYTDSGSYFKFFFFVFTESVLGSNSMTRQWLRSNVWVTYQKSFLKFLKSELNYSTPVYGNLTTSRSNLSQVQKNRINARKRQRIDSDDDDEVIE